MRRRRFIALTGVAAVGLAGCADVGEDPSGGAGSPTPGTQTTPTPTGPPADAPTLRAEHEWLQPAVVTLNVDAVTVKNRNERQFLYLDVGVESGDPPRRSDLRVRFDGQLHAPAAIERLYRAYPEEDGRYRQRSGEGWVLFDLPATGDASDLALVDGSSGAEWPITAQASMNLDGRLAAPAPPLSVELTVPESVVVDEEPTLSMTVTNEGDRDGTFVGGVNRHGPAIAVAPVATVREVIPPDDPTTVEVTDDMGFGHIADDDLGDGDADMTYHLEWTGETRSSDVRIEESSGSS